jgi:cell division protein FtsL
MSVRLNVVLGIALMFCALLLINAQFQARRLFIELERAETLKKQYDLQWSQLKLDQSTFGKHSRIEQVANKDLGMVVVSPERTQYLTAEVAK